MVHTCFQRTRADTDPCEMCQQYCTQCAVQLREAGLCAFSSGEQRHWDNGYMSSANI